MSKQSVLMKCVKNDPECNIKAMEKDIVVEMARFERAARASWNASWSLNNVMFSHRHDKANARNEMYEKNKRENIELYFELMIDLYDYRRIVLFKGKKDA